MQYLQTPQYTIDGICELIEGKLERRFGCCPEEATPTQLFRATALAVQHILADIRHESLRAVETSKAKETYYLSAEFLLGRSLINNIHNLGLKSLFEASLVKLGTSLGTLYGIEPDAGLGNGGLGRLAACYMDSLTTLAYPVQGYSIRYEFGIFRQRLADGWQVEMPDDWLDDGEVWLIPRADETVEVRMGGIVDEKWGPGGHEVIHEGYESILAVPYDMLISGYGGRNVNVLRLWGAKSPIELDMALFSRGEYMRAMERNAQAEIITKILYPADDHVEGKQLRLRQQYLLVSASLQDVVAKHLARHGGLDTLPDKAILHINDTHPAMAIPELMRILLDEHGYVWEKAWDIVTRSFAYTNHTVMGEALERWPQDLMGRVVPRIWSIVREIDRRLCDDVEREHPGDWGKRSRMAIVGDWDVRMANLCLAASSHVNGVSQLHTDILVSTFFRDFAERSPGKFLNITNGIAHRRWLAQANPFLSDFIIELIGSDYMTDASRLTDLNRFKSDPRALERLSQIKLCNKVRLADYIAHFNGIKVDPTSIFDVQVKRLHEYKRQLLNVLYILDLYVRLTEDSSESSGVTPRTFIFGAKASPGYHMAKQIIRLISKTGELVNNSAAVRDRLRVVFIEDYNVSKAEIIMPAAEVSQQISVAGKEASGTGNMKFMLNGALTLGTLDGANVEMREAVGDENIFIFGMTADQVEQLWREGYDPKAYLTRSPSLNRVMELLRSGIAGTSFTDIADYLLTGWGGQADPFMCLADYEAYADAQQNIQAAYTDDERWNRMSLANIAAAGRFAADVSVEKYAREVWGITPLRELELTNAFSASEAAATSA